MDTNNAHDPSSQFTTNIATIAIATTTSDDADQENVSSEQVPNDGNNSQQTTGQPPANSQQPPLLVNVEPVSLVDPSTDIGEEDRNIWIHSYLERWHRQSSLSTTTTMAPTVSSLPLSNHEEPKDAPTNDLLKSWSMGCDPKKCNPFGII